MGVANSLFHNTDSNVQTLHRLIMPSAEQQKRQRNRWHELAEFLVPWLAEQTEKSVRWWLQGSYKFGTQVRPKRGEEFDIDFGLYVEWRGEPTAGLSPELLKQLLQQGLHEYAATGPQDLKEIAPPKERCCRIIYSDHFHVDVPIYHLDPERDLRSLATESKGWEDSDPKALVEWFRSNAGEDEERSQLRRVIRYLKCWANLRFEIDQKPSSILLTVLSTTAFKRLPASLVDDDEVFVAVVREINSFLTQNRTVANPVDSNENLNRMDDENWERFKSKVSELYHEAVLALAQKNEIEAADAWTKIFSYFFPLPDEVLADNQRRQLPAIIRPDIKIFAQDQRRVGRDFHGINNLPTIPKNYNIRFAIHGNIPPGASAHWTVRNRGTEAETENDLGHRCVTGAVVQETSKYNGTHFMDCMLKDDSGRILGVRRISIQIFDGIRRNQPKPGYVRARNAVR